jgi:hypothetical protein
VSIKNKKYIGFGGACFAISALGRLRQKDQKFNQDQPGIQSKALPQKKIVDKYIFKAE